MKKLKRTILEIRPVFSSGKVHLDVVKGLALAEVVVIGGSEEASLVAPHDRLQIPTMDVEGHSFKSGRKEDEGMSRTQDLGSSRTQALGWEPASWVPREPKLGSSRTQAPRCEPTSWVREEPKFLGANPRVGFLVNPRSWVRTCELGSSRTQAPGFA
ncbi:hypothetical protein SLEP1_g2947 [Rubroshorea leprosula]|uniref:Uncharacterized protein n=1 Tax=Rubroshorea leprosula TaxID=152421 RepID=A0AAV5HIU6_9ROSI|nr:hypothetical protein SLEP1_g2947 [Rubroshorea leprosula]